MLRPLSLAEIGKLSTIAEPVGTASLLLLPKPEELRVSSRAVWSCSDASAAGQALTRQTTEGQRLAHLLPRVSDCSWTFGHWPSFILVIWHECAGSQNWCSRLGRHQGRDTFLSLREFSAESAVTDGFHAKLGAKLSEAGRTGRQPPPSLLVSSP